jgi:hypothetical protein
MMMNKNGAEIPDGTTIVQRVDVKGAGFPKKGVSSLIWA